jgi:hypothetical protein
VKPSWGASASICAADGVPEEGGVGPGTGADKGEGVGTSCEDVGEGEGEGEGEGAVGGGAVPALIAAA